jgi:hypothetical protein
MNWQIIKKKLLDLLLHHFIKNMELLQGQAHHEGEYTPPLH